VVLWVRVGHIHAPLGAGHGFRFCGSGFSNSVVYFWAGVPMWFWHHIVIEFCCDRLDVMPLLILRLMLNLFPLDMLSSTNYIPKRGYHYRFDAIMMEHTHAYREQWYNWWTGTNMVDKVSTEKAQSHPRSSCTNNVVKSHCHCQHNLT